MLFISENCCGETGDESQNLSLVLKKFADPQKILTRWKNYFCQLLNVQWVRDIRQTKIQTAQPHVPKPSASEFEVAIRKLKRYKPPGSDQIPAGGGGHCIL
jgi:hypothetical protein